MSAFWQHHMLLVGVRLFLAVPGCSCCEVVAHAAADVSASSTRSRSSSSPVAVDESMEEALHIVEESLHERAAVSGPQGCCTTSGSSKTCSSATRAHRVHGLSCSCWQQDMQRFIACHALLGCGWGWHMWALAAAGSCEANKATGVSNRHLANQLSPYFVCGVVAHTCVCNNVVC